jgi:hypothetical protein
MGNSVTESSRIRFPSSSRNRKTYAIKTFVGFLHQVGAIRANAVIFLRATVKDCPSLQVASGQTIGG